jgi:hypothetical protein
MREQVYREELARWVEQNPPPPGIEMHGSFPTRGRVMAQPGAAQSDKDREADRWYVAWTRADQEARMRSLRGNSELLRQDWRPLCSYVGNLERMGDLLLNTEGAWVTVGKAFVRAEAAMAAFGGPRGGPQPLADEHRLADDNVMQFPWQWSAGVLAGLAGLSTWTLFRRVKSLDRLR